MPALQLMNKEPEFTNMLCAVQKAKIEAEGDNGQNTFSRVQAIGFVESLKNSGYLICKFRKELKSNGSHDAKA